MKITITVDEAVFDKEIENKFSDFFNRVITDIKYPDVVQGLYGNFEYETADMLKNAFYAAKYNEETDTDKHWEESRQIALYDDQLRKAMELLGEVSGIHYAAIRNNSQEAALLSGELMHKIRQLELEIKDSCHHGEVQDDE